MRGEREFRILAAAMLLSAVGSNPLNVYAQDEKPNPETGFFPKDPPPLKFEYYTDRKPNFVETDLGMVRIIPKELCFSQTEGRMDFLISIPDPTENNKSIIVEMNRLSGPDPLMFNQKVEASVELSQNKLEDILSVQKDISVKLTVKQKVGNTIKAFNDYLPYVLRCFGRDIQVDQPEEE